MDPSFGAQNTRISPARREGWMHVHPAISFWRRYAASSASMAVAVAILLLGMTAFDSLLWNFHNNADAFNVIWIISYGAAAYLLLRQARMNWIIRVGRDLVLLGLIVFMAGLSAIWSIEPARTVIASFYLLGAVLAGIFIGYVWGGRKFTTILELTFTALITVNVLSVLPSLSSAISAGLWQANWAGLTANRNILGFSASLASVFFLTTVVCGKNFSYRRFTMMVLSMFAVGLTGSATSSIAVIVGVSVVATFHIARGFGFRSRDVFVTFLVGLVLVAGTAGYFLPEFAKLFGRDTTLTNRTPLWDAAIEIIRRFPVGGLGYGAVWGFGPDARVPAGVSAVGGAAPHAHNGYIQIAAELGIPAFLLACAFILRVLWQSQKTYARRPSSSSLFCAAALFMYVVANLSESLLFTIPSWPEHRQDFWILFVAISTNVFRNLSRAPNRQPQGGMKRAAGNLFSSRPPSGRDRPPPRRLLPSLLVWQAGVSSHIYGRRNVGVSFVCVSIAVSLSAWIWLETSREVPAVPVVPFDHVLDPDVGFRPPRNFSWYGSTPSPSSRGIEHAVEYTNGDSLRVPSPDAAIAVPKPEGQIRIAVLGGAAVRSGTLFADTLPGALERVLARRYPHASLHVINAGLPMAVSRQELLFLATKLVDYDLDILVVYDGHQDSSQPLYFERRPNFPYHFRMIENALGYYLRLPSRSLIDEITGRSAVFSYIFKPSVLSLQGFETVSPDELLRDRALRASYAVAHLDNWSRIERVSRAYDIAPFFVLQPTPLSSLFPGGTRGEAPAGTEFDALYAQLWVYEEFRKRVADFKQAHADVNVLDLANFLSAEQFYDGVHVFDDVNESLAEELAGLLSDEIERLIMTASLEQRNGPAKAALRGR